jgi:hypothetical protein
MKQGWNEQAHSHLRTHGHRSDLQRTPTYVCWVNLKSRCDNPARPDYENYGARGISYDPRWKEFAAFLNDMGEKPARTSLDRIDNSKGYCKENCRWTSALVQGSNKRNNKFYEYGGRSQTLMEWGRELSIGHVTLLKRLQRGIPIAVALTMQKHSRKSKLLQLN